MVAKGDSAHWTTAAADDAVESMVLQHLLSIHPTQVTLPELVREVEGEEVSFGRHDAIERAVRDLTATGLLHHRNGLLQPTRAALRFSELTAR